MKIKDRPVNMPCSDPEGCKHFKAEIQLNERIKMLEAALLHIAEDGCPKCGNVAEQALKG